MYIAVVQTSHESDDIPESQAYNLGHHRFFPFALDNKGGGRHAYFFCTI